MSGRKREHLDDYQLAEDGTYQYQGRLWHWADQAERRAFLRAAWALLGIAFACLVCAGFVPLPASGFAALALVPYAAALVATALVAVCLAKITREGMDLRDYVYVSNVLGLRPRLVFGALLAGVSALGEVACAVTSLVQGEPLSWAAAVFVACMLVCSSSLWLLRRRATELTFTS